MGRGKKKKKERKKTLAAAQSPRAVTVTEKNEGEVFANMHAVPENKAERQQGNGGRYNTSHTENKSN